MNRMTKIALALAVAFGSGAALADSNNAAANQTGNNNVANITQDTSYGSNAVRNRIPNQHQ